MIASSPPILEPTSRSTSFIDEQVTIAVPLEHAAKRLRRFFNSRGNADGSAAEVGLGGSVATMRLQRMENRLAPRYLLEWTQPNPISLPPFAGELFVVGDDDYTSFALVLRGGYAPSLEGPDRTFEPAASGRVARATARYLLLQIRDFVEVDFGTDEKRRTETIRRSRTRLRGHTPANRAVAPGDGSYTADAYTSGSDDAAAPRALL